MQNEITQVSCSTCQINRCNLQKTTQKRSKIAKMVPKKAYFCHLHKNEWQVEQETNVFIFYSKFLISGHPWHPWACQYNFCYCSGKDAGDIPHSEKVEWASREIHYQSVRKTLVLSFFATFCYFSSDLDCHVSILEKIYWIFVLGLLSDRSLL